MNKFFNILFGLYILVRIAIGLYLGIKKGDWEELMRYGTILGILILVLLIYESIKSKKKKDSAI